MSDFVDKIANKQYEAASKDLTSSLSNIVEKKLIEKKKMVAASKFAEAVVQKDGLVHLAGGEKVLPSVHNLRRGLMEGSGDVHPADDWDANFAERHSNLSRKLKDDQTNPARRAVQRHLDQAKKYHEDDPEKAEDHLKQAEKLHRMSQGKNLEEASKKEKAVMRFFAHDPEAGQKVLDQGKKDRATQKGFDQGKKEIENLKKKGLEEEQLNEASLLGRLRDAVSSAKDISKNKQGEHVFRRGFFYSGGATSEHFADKVSKELTDAGIKHTVTGHDTIDKPFKGGAGIRQNSHFLVRVKIHDKKEQLDELKKETLQRYKLKASRQLDHDYEHTTGSGGRNIAATEKLEKRIGKRERGLEMVSKKIEEDCLDPDKEAILNSSLEAARIMTEPKLDTTAPKVNRKIVFIPKATRPADRLTAPDVDDKLEEEKDEKAIKNAFKVATKNPDNPKVGKYLKTAAKEVKKKLDRGEKIDEEQLDEISDELKAKYKEKAKGNLDLAKFTKKELFGPQTKVFDKKHKFNKQLANTIKKRKKGLKLASKLDEARKMSGWFADGKEDLEGNPHPTVRKNYLMALAQHKKGNIEDAHKHMKAALNADMRRKQKVSDEPGMEQGNMDEEQINEAATRKDFRLVADLIKNVPNEKKRKILAQHHADIFTAQNPRFDRKKFLTASGVKHDD